jgi:hypothetical protein
MRQVTAGIVIVLVLTLALAGCQPTGQPTPGELPSTGETVGPPEEATPVAPAEESPTVPGEETPPAEEAETPPAAATPAAEETPTEEEAETPAAEETPTLEEGETPAAEETPTVEEGETPAAETPTTEEAETPAAGAVPTVDGIIDEDEYPNTATINAIELWWYNDGESLSVALQAPTEGWVGIGLDPENMMQGADLKLAAALDGEMRVTDAFGTGPSGPVHPPDEELGGTDDIEEAMVVTEDGVTRFEFRIPLDTGDQYDKPLEPGNTYPIIVAFGPSDEYNAYHAFRQMSEITLDPAP